MQNELSFDRFHKNAGQIYRIASNFGDSKSADNSAGMPAGLKAELPVIKNTVRIGKSTPILFEFGNKKLIQKLISGSDGEREDWLNIINIQCMLMYTDKGGSVNHRCKKRFFTFFIFFKN